MEFTYNPGLVALSIVAGILGAFTGLVMMSGIGRVRGAERVLRIVLGGLGIGGGIWSMHFIAMLAVVLPLKLSYSIPETIISAAFAIVFTTLALWIVACQTLRGMSLPLSALLLGAGIGAMHYLGMYGIRGCLLQYSWLSVVISLLIGVNVSAAALWFAFRARGVADTIIGSIALGLAIALMHYTAMEATRFLPSSSAGQLANVFNGRVLAVAVAITLYSICSICLIAFAVLTFAKRRRPARLLIAQRH